MDITYGAVIAKARPMNFNVYLDQATGDRLDRLAKVRRTSRNALIREAIAQLLDRAPDAGWPRAVREFEGVPKALRFEASRKRLRAPRRDPLA